MNLNLKLALATIYIICLGVLLFFVFSNLELRNLTNYTYIKDITSNFLAYKSANLLLFTLSFILISILWIFLLGFGSPIALLGGFIFGKWIGTIVVILGLSFGATFLYIFGNYFLKDIIKDRFSKKFQNLQVKFKDSEFLYLLVYRLIGGIPWQLSCLLPTIFNVKISNFYFATLIGVIPTVFLMVSIGNGLEKVINQNSEIPLITDIIFSPDIYIPLLAFFSLIFITIFLRKIFYKN